MKTTFLLFPLLVWTSLAPFTGHAWERHQSLMAGILAGVPVDPMGIDKPLAAPCLADDLRIYAHLAHDLHLNPNVVVSPTSAEACASRHPVTGREILNSPVVDEPDQGMDQDLPGSPESFDPQHAARWMGGTSGRTSTGFRHMFFGGWQIWHPIHTFQIPPRALGYAPERATITAMKAQDMIHQGGIEAVWGYRVLGWALHYLQDMSQPFHAVQVPDLAMVPWYAILRWPPSAGFADLVHETTRTIANYHWAFEHYTYYRLTAQVGTGAGKEITTPYRECLERPDPHAVLSDDPRKDELTRDPALLAQRTARASVQIGGETGAAIIAFFGKGLKDRAVDIPAQLGEPDYAEMTLRPDLSVERQELLRISCRALADASLASRNLIQVVK